ncbi:YwdI family protein [Virgibacillus doumboii]|uniref:YwdI family protein n=1 Tax=Virgibacillus doumboii TaxID=2697503 RepID=UPI0013DF27B3|nr:YwdI family protein [Virgibacillus doumboii]
MAVANETIIQKMMNELTEAKKKANDSKSMEKHIANVQLLCELLLGEISATPSTDNEITEEEMKAMIGTNDTKRKYTKTTINDDDANGDSIFDF